MTYLQICQRVHDIAGFQGQFTSVQATGYQAILTTAVRDTYQDIQRYRKDWWFMQVNKDISVDETKTRYEISDLFGVGDIPFGDYQYINWYKTGTTRRTRLIEVPYHEFQFFSFTDNQSKEPRLWTQEPFGKALVISPVDTNYTLDLHYIREIDDLSSNSQEPIIPARFHQALVYGALIKLSTYIGNPTLFDEYSMKYAEIMGQLMREENPAKHVIKRPIA